MVSSVRTSVRKREALGGGWWEIKGGDILRLMKCVRVLFTEDGSSAVYRTIGSLLFKKKLQITFQVLTTLLLI